MTQSDCDGVHSVISAKRFQPFLEKCEGDRAAAERLCAWDGEAARALWSPVRDLEVSFRNAAHRQLAGKWGQAWWVARQPNSWGQGEIEAAREKLVRRRRPDSPDDIVAQLSFGFWVSLLSNGNRQGFYRTWYWSPSLQYLFPEYRGRRDKLHDQFGRMQTLRNRIAHHERIFQRHLEEDYRTAMHLLRLVAPGLADQHDKYGQVPEVLARRAAVVTGREPIRL